MNLLTYISIVEQRWKRLGWKLRLAVFGLAAETAEQFWFLFHSTGLMHLAFTGWLFIMSLAMTALLFWSMTNQPEP